MPPKTKSKAKAKAPASAKKDSSAKLQFAGVDLAALVGQQIAAEQSGSSKKRKDRSPQVETPKGSPSKKRRSSTPPPGSEEYKLLPPVSISALVDAALNNSAGNADTAFGTVVGGSERPKRKITKTAKAKVDEVQGKGSKSKKVPLDVLIASASAIAEGKDAAAASPVNDVVALFSEGQQVTPASSAPCTPKCEACPLPGSNASSVNSDEEQAVDDQSSEEGVGDDQNSEPEDVESVNEQPKSMDNRLNVMLDPCPDPLLAPFYASLPPLPRLCEVKPFTGSLLRSLRTNFADKCAGLRPEDIQNILKALSFTKSGFFVNTARVHPSKLVVEKARLRVREPTSLAVGVMTGTAIESNLVDPALAGPLSNRYAIHKLTLAPFQQDWCRDVSVWGLLFGFPVITGSISEEGFSFATRGEGKDGYRSVTSSPVKGVQSVSSPLFAVSPDGSYPSSRSFNDLIPVYDGRGRNGRPPFTFSDADFQRLSSWPLYRKGPCEVPAGAVVSVGYTLSTYPGSTGTVLSSNIQFVILLATS